MDDVRSVTSLTFASQEFISEMGRVWRRHVAEYAHEIGKECFSLSETYVDTPTHLLPMWGVAGFHVRVRGSQCEFFNYPADDCDMTVSLEYELARRLKAAIVTDPEHRFVDPEMTALYEDGVRSGRIRRLDKVSHPSWVLPIHNLTAALL